LANELALLFAVDNIIKQRNALISQTQPLVISIQKVVQQFPGLLNGSHGNIELLTWVLFMVVMVPHEFVGKDWARMVLSHVVRGVREGAQSKVTGRCGYGEAWPNSPGRIGRTRNTLMMFAQISARR